MRRLLLAAALLAIPAVAAADDPVLPPSSYDMAGCSLTGICITFRVYQSPTINGDGLPSFRALAGITSVQCPTFALCGINGFKATIYDAAGDRIMSYENGTVPRNFLEPIPTPGTAIVNFGWIPNGPNGEALEGHLPTPVSIVVTTTPEPATVMLFGSGLVGLLGLRRRRLQPDEA